MFAPATSMVINLDSLPADSERSATSMPTNESGQTRGVAPVNLGQDSAIASATQLVVPVADAGGSSSADVVVDDLSAHSAATAGCSTFLVAEMGRNVVEDEYEFESDLDPNDVQLFQEGFTNSTVRAEG